MAARRTRLVLAFVVVGALSAASAPALYRAWWRARADNPVRHGVRLAEELGCFHCHGELGRRGLPDPLAWSGAVPSWPGSAATLGRDELRRVIRDGDLEGPREPAAPLDHALAMPAYGDVIGERQLEALVAAVVVLSGGNPPGDDAARRGLELAEAHGCPGCHGPGGSGGLANPRSATGFIPGWYGADFEHLVRDRSEFDAWVRRGRSARLQANPLAAWFTGRQLIAMPAYADIGDAELDDLWAYARWLGATDGGTGAVTPLPPRGSTSPTPAPD